MTEESCKSTWVSKTKELNMPFLLKCRCMRFFRKENTKNTRQNYEEGGRFQAPGISHGSHLLRSTSIRRRESELDSFLIR